eukprot:TRINITY_DN55609_c0_g1_i1.p1 TRINITY_DN55609_c0_g1~~TRINITY_DN55609_c0_g1_i1.p1  ORF type:complete len:631 (+),score=137.76 TRINITY_DN55609_c0_g1_i1:99-1895(+)
MSAAGAVKGKGKGGKGRRVVMPNNPPRAAETPAAVGAANGTGAAAPGRAAERRIDPSCGIARTLHEFIAGHGAVPGVRLWAEAPDSASATAGHPAGAAAVAYPGGAGHVERIEDWGAGDEGGDGWGDDPAPAVPPRTCSPAAAPAAPPAPPPAAAVSAPPPASPGGAAPRSPAGSPHRSPPAPGSSGAPAGSASPRSQDGAAAAAGAPAGGTAAQDYGEDWGGGDGAAPEEEYAAWWSVNEAVYSEVLARATAWFPDRPAAAEAAANLICERVHPEHLRSALGDEAAMGLIMVDVEESFAREGHLGPAAPSGQGTERVAPSAAAARRARSAAAAAGPERRVDPADGGAYTREEFFAEYGDYEKWDQCAPPSGEPGSSSPAAKPQRQRAKRRHAAGERQGQSPAEEAEADAEARAGNLWLQTLEWPEEPPVRKTGVGVSYEFLDHTADVILHGWDTTLLRTWEQLVLAMFAYMVNDGDRTLEGSVRITDSIDVAVDGLDRDYLLMKFMQEFLYYFADPERKLLIREVRIVGADFDSIPMRLAARGWGERHRPHGPDRHPKGTDVKAVTLECMQNHPPGHDTESPSVPSDHWSCYCIVDI